MIAVIKKKRSKILLAVILRMFAFVSTVEEFAVKQLDSHDGEDEMEEHVNDEDVKNVLEWVDHAVEYGLQLRHPFDSLQRPQDSQDSQWLDGAQVLAGRAPPIKPLVSIGIFGIRIQLKWEEQANVNYNNYAAGNIIYIYIYIYKDREMSDTEYVKQRVECQRNLLFCNTKRLRHFLPTPDLYVQQQWCF